MENEKAISEKENINFKTNITDYHSLNILVDIFKSVNDPEIPISIYDLGLIYEVIMNGNSLNIKLNLTAIGCPYYREIINNIKNEIKNKLNITDVNVEFIFDPPWNPSRMTKEGRDMYKAIYGYDPVEIWLREQKEFEEEQRELEEEL